MRANDGTVPNQIGHVLGIGSAEMLAAAAYMIDLSPTGCLYHSWRTALVAEHLASAIEPELCRDVFYSGLLHDIGTAGADLHILQYPTREEQADDAYIRSHPRRTCALIEWLPGMSNVAKYSKWHHELWNGCGYPDGLAGDEIPLGSQILRIADSADMAGCFSSLTHLADGLKKLAIDVGKAWSKEMWTALVNSTQDIDFYRTITDRGKLHSAVAAKLKELPVPEELQNDEGVERVFHVFAALIDAKDVTTAGHSLRTAKLAKQLAKKMGMSDEDVQLAYRAGLVHDCGLLGIPTKIAQRCGKLKKEEVVLVRRHAEMTNRIFCCLPDYPDLMALGDIAGHDHERYDGNGYPDGISGKAIHPISRILSVADAFDAMTSNNNYKYPVSPRFAMVRLQQACGTQFDPTVVDALTSIVANGHATDAHGRLLKGSQILCSIVAIPLFIMGYWLTALLC